MAVIVRGSYRTVGYTLINNKQTKEPDTPDNKFRVGFVIGSDAIIRK